MPVVTLTWFCPHCSMQSALLDVWFWNWNMNREQLKKSFKINSNYYGSMACSYIVRWSLVEFKYRTNIRLSVTTMLHFDGEAISRHMSVAWAISMQCYEHDRFKFKGKCGNWFNKWFIFPLFLLFWPLSQFLVERLTTFSKN